MSVAEAAIYTGVPTSFAIGLITYFRSEVRVFLKNTRQVKIPGGFEISSTPSEQVATDPEKAALPASPETPNANSNVPVALADASPLIIQIERALRHELDDRAPTDITVQFDTAVRALAIARALLAHEANYRVIFSTQIMLMKSLNDGTVRSTEQAIFWYNVFHQRLPDVPITFEDWLRFLLNCGYVQLGGSISDKSENLMLDPFGKDFLLWMTHNGIPEGKPG